eukprot:TRINITY_DN55034_c0_g1_i1.p1 TRINITY_DN55034_c0_g1~~TRINITY_DN55034_c0_g1_i1.p1  ORF type:complete len:332 (-),score=57.55 TRINITY_DN55034_c0_g1_i1:122-1117(-)
MVSLNDLEAQIAALASDDGDSEGSSSDSPDEHTAGVLGKRTKKTKASKRKNPQKKRALVKGSKQEGKDEEEEGAGEETSTDDGGGDVSIGANTSNLPSKKRRRRGVSLQVCFRFLAGKCHFDDCAFRHTKANKLETEQLAQVLQELPLRKFDPDLAEVIGALNIPKCRDFHQKGRCPRKQGKCHYWHLSDAKIARWAGFPFWCEACKKGFTSQQQVSDHEQGKAHQQASGSNQGAAAFRGGRGGRGGRGFGGSSCDTRADEKREGGDLGSEAGPRLRGRGGGRGRGGRGGGHESENREEESKRGEERAGECPRGRGRGLFRGRGVFPGANG